MTWSDAVSTWGDANQAWNGQTSGLVIAAPPGVYVKDPGVNSNMLRATIVTQDVPGQPAGDATMCLKVVVPPGQEATHIEYDLLPNYYPFWQCLANRGWFSVSAGDDGGTWAGTPAWFSSAGGSVYKRSGNTVYRILGGSEFTYSARARIPESDWVDANHIVGVPATLNPALPAGMSRVWAPSVTAKGPRALSAGTAHDVSVLTRTDRTMWRRASYPSVTLALSGTNVTTFTVRSSPVGHTVRGYVKWAQGTNFVIASFGPVADNTAVTTAMCTVINNWDTTWIGSPVSALSGWGGNWYTPTGAGVTFTVEAYSLIGAGTSTDPYNQSAQGYFLYTP